VKRLTPIAIFGLIVSFLFFGPVVRAQTSSAIVVSACGTPPVTYVVGQAYPQTQTAGGVACGGSGGGGSSSITSTVLPTGATNNPTTQVTVTTSSTTLVAARAGRALLTVQNNGTNPEWVGPCPAVASTGLEIYPNGGSITYPSAAQWCGIATGGSNSNSTLEIY
jgi:hypothetical protein